MTARDWLIVGARPGWKDSEGEEASSRCDGAGRRLSWRRNKNIKQILMGLVLLGLAGSGFGQEMKMVKMEDLVWKEGPMFKGAQVAILVGDPMKAEAIVLRVKFPPHYRVPPHTHPYAEVVTVLSGNYWNSFGQSFDKSKGVELHPGSVFVLPAGHAHYTWTEDTEVIVQTNFTGPRGVSFINPGDDPRKRR